MKDYAKVVPLTEYFSGIETGTYSIDSVNGDRGTCTGTKNTSTGSLGPTLLVLTILELKLMELMELAL